LSVHRGSHFIRLAFISCFDSDELVPNTSLEFGVLIEIFNFDVAQEVFVCWIIFRCILLFLFDRVLGCTKAPKNLAKQNVGNQVCRQVDYVSLLQTHKVLSCWRERVDVVCCVEDDGTNEVEYKTRRMSAQCSEIDVFFFVPLLEKAPDLHDTAYQDDARDD
jgi:hypothetical protein